MEILYIGLLVAAVSGVSFIAYKHPELYEKEFSPKLFYTSLGMFLVSIFFDSGVSSAYVEFIPYLKENHTNEIQAALKEAKINDSIYLCSLCVMLYSVFLSWLANHMKNKQNSNRNA